MTTSFSSLPIIDLSKLSGPHGKEEDLSKQLHDVFSTTGFAYLINAPLTFSHDDVFSTARSFFDRSQAEKWRLAKRIFNKSNTNTYRGYFPPQPGQQDNLKEGFEIGPPQPPKHKSKARQQKVDLTEANVWPSETAFPGGRERLTKLHAELQDLASTLLSLLATSLGKPQEFFLPYLTNSVSTLRLLHYPPQPEQIEPGDVKLCCTPHTDSGIMTLLHQDSTGGLEVLNANGDWIPAPYIPGSIVVNIGDLLTKVSGGRFVATMHRVRVNGSGTQGPYGYGRFSVPFFFEPGEDCVVRSVDGGDEVVYGEHVREKMATWVEFQDIPDDAMPSSVSNIVAVEA